MPKKVKTRAITSEQMERAFEEAIRERNAAYYFVYRLIIDTGLPFTVIAALKVRDVYQKTEIEAVTHAGGMRTSQIPERLQKEINDYCKGRDSSEYFLRGKNNKNPLNSSTITQVFAATSKQLKLDPPITVKSCHKTFIYHLMLTDGNCKRARSYLHVNSEEDIYEYIGLPVPEDGKKSALTKTDLICSNIVPATSDKANATFYKIEQSLRTDDELSLKECANIKNFCDKVDSAVTEYRLRKGE